MCNYPSLIGLHTEKELYQLNPFLPMAYEIKSKSITKSAMQKVPSFLLLHWDFLNEALTVS